jgi:hypothetical protein
MKYESPITYHSKDMANVKSFWKVGQTSRSSSKIMVPIERSCHKKHTYEILKPYHLLFNRYGQCLSFWKVGQTSRSRSQGKKLWYQ